MSVPKLDGVLETALYVVNLGLSLSFYRKIFEFETLYSDQRLCALSVSNKQVLLLFLKRASSMATVSSGGVIPPHDGDGNLHLAFSIAVSNLEQWKNWLFENDIKIESEYQ